MTVSTTNSRDLATGNGTVGPFTFTFTLQQATDMNVYVSGSVISQGLYTITPNGGSYPCVGGSISWNLLANAPATGVPLVFASAVAYTQPLSLPVETDFPEKSLENAIDRNTLQIQQLKLLTDLSLHFAVTENVNALLSGPQALYIPRMNAANTGMEFVSAAQIANEVTAGNGNVVGPASAADGAIVAFNGTTGKIIKTASTVPISQGGTGATALTDHGVVVAGASSLTTVAPGASGNILKSNGTDWVSAAPTSGVSKFTTSAQAVSNAGGASIAHGLGAVPTFLTARLKCITTDAGYAVGDYVEIGTGAQSPPDSAYFALGADGTNLFYRFYNSATPIQITHKTTGLTTSVAIAKWELYVTAYLIT